MFKSKSDLFETNFVINKFLVHVKCWWLRILKGYTSQRTRFQAPIFHSLCWKTSSLYSLKLGQGSHQELRTCSRGLKVPATACIQNQERVDVTFPHLKPPGYLRWRINGSKNSLKDFSTSPSVILPINIIIKINLV